MELQGRAALVTGASRGIGRACAEALARAGCAVALTARDAAAGEAAAAAIRDAGGAAIFLQQDVADAAAWPGVVAEAERRLGGLDTFVANAGVSFPKNATDMTLDAFRSLCAVNLGGVFFGLQAMVEAMRRKGRGGSAILMSSIMGKIAAPGYTHYCAAKEGVRLMAKAAALELGPENIRVNSVHPGLISTDMTAIFPKDALAPMIPLGRFGEPQEIADAVVFLASDRSKFMTGAELVVDGAMSVR